MINQEKYNEKKVKRVQKKLPQGKPLTWQLAIVALAHYRRRYDA